jgi:hypothetical protein
MKKEKEEDFSVCRGVKLRSKYASGASAGNFSLMTH